MYHVLTFLFTVTVPGSKMRQHISCTAWYSVECSYIYFLYTSCPGQSTAWGGRMGTYQPLDMKTGNILATIIKNMLGRRCSYCQVIKCISNQQDQLQIPSTPSLPPGSTHWYVPHPRIGIKHGQGAGELGLVVTRRRR